MRGDSGKNKSCKTATVPTNDFEFDTKYVPHPHPPYLVETIDQSRAVNVVKPVPRKPPASTKSNGHKLLSSLPSLVANLRKPSSTKSKRSSVGSLGSLHGHYFDSHPEAFSHSVNDVSVYNDAIKPPQKEGFFRKNPLRRNNSNSSKRYSWALGDKETEFYRYESNNLRNYAMSHSPIAEDASEEISEAFENLNLKSCSNSKGGSSLDHIQHNMTHNSQLLTNRSEASYFQPIRKSQQCIARQPVYSVQCKVSDGIEPPLDGPINEWAAVGICAQSPGAVSRKGDRAGSVGLCYTTATSSAYSSCFDAKEENSEFQWNKEKALLTKLYEDKLLTADKRYKDLELYYNQMWERENPQALKQELRRNANELSATQNTVKNLSNLLSDKDCELMCLREQLNSVCMEVQKQCRLVGQLQQRLTDVNNHHSIATSHANQLQAELNHSFAESARLQSENAKLNQIISKQKETSPNSSNKGDANLRNEISRLEAEMESLKQEKTYQTSLFERERLCWLEEKELVLRYQKQLQASYQHVHNVNKNLQKQLHRFNNF